MTPISFQDRSVAPLPLIVVVVMHAGAFAALFHPSPGGVVALIVLYVISGLGITVGYHRMLSHRSFHAGRWTARALGTAGALALQGGPGNWVAMHRLHHAHPDTDFDPHNAARGFFHSHVRWIVNELPESFLQIRYTRIAKDVVRDPYFRWLGDNHYLLNVAVGVLLAGRTFRVPVGNLPAHHARASRHLAGQLGEPHLGQQAVRWRGGTQQRAGRGADHG